MRSMRDIISLFESSFPTTNGDQLVGEIMHLMGLLSGMGFEFKADWVSETIAKVKQQKLETEADEAGERLKAETEGTSDEDEEEVTEGEESEVEAEAPEQPADEPKSEEPDSSFDAKASFSEAADAVFSGASHVGDILSDVTTALRTYKDDKTVDPDNLGQELETTPYMTCMESQRELVDAFEKVTPSKPSTYSAVLDGVRGVLDQIHADKTDKPEFVPSIKNELELLLPLMRFTLQSAK